MNKLIGVLILLALAWWFGPGIWHGVMLALAPIVEGALVVLFLIGVVFSARFRGLVGTVLHILLVVTGIALVASLFGGVSDEDAMIVTHFD